MNSHCEHHMIPFIGKAHVAYFPAEKVVGISKLARVVDIFARRLQTQETMTAQIAEAINQALEPKGVAVMIEAVHQCMSLRGVQKPECGDDHDPVHRALQGRSGPAAALPDARAARRRADLTTAGPAWPATTSRRRSAPRLALRCRRPRPGDRDRCRSTGEALMLAYMNAEAAAGDARDRHRPLLVPVARPSSGARARRAATSLRSSSCASTAIRTRSGCGRGQRRRQRLPHGLRTCFYRRLEPRRRRIGSFRARRAGCRATRWLVFTDCQRRSVNLISSVSSCSEPNVATGTGLAALAAPSDSCLSDRPGGRWP